MKKVGLLLLALVVALGALGVGYAKWSDNVSIAGTITTGNVSIGITDQGTFDDGQADGMFSTYNFAEADTIGSDPNVAPGNNAEGKNFASHVSYNNGTCIGYSCYGGAYESITEEITNAYPWYASATVIGLANLGTVPVKIDEVTFISKNDPKHVMDFMQVDNWYLMYDSEPDEFGHVHLITATGNGFFGATGLANQGHVQIPAGTCATLIVYFHFNEEVGNSVMPQGATGANALTFTANVKASQWNEVGTITP
jgi:predicted ribosomally synthesized peptide with SipW-like signal peptide